MERIEGIGLRFRELKNILLPGSTDTEFAKFLDIQRSYINLINNNKLKIDDVLKLKLYDLGINLNWLFTGNETPFNRSVVGIALYEKTTGVDFPMVSQLIAQNEEEFYKYNSVQMMFIDKNMSVTVRKIK